MNKYKEALDFITDCIEFNYITIKDLEAIDFYCDMVQELVDKETPVKPINQYPIDFGLGNYGECRVCNCGVSYQQNYCSECGQKIGWSDEE